jgi:hypothetical protein
MVIRFLDIEQVKENDILAKGGTVNGKDPQWCMALYEQETVKFRPGDCKSYFEKGKCNRSSCPYSHDNTMPAWARKPGKGKGKGKKGKGKKGKGKKGKGKGKKGKGKGKGKGKDKGKKGKGKGKKDSGKGKSEKWCATCQSTSHSWKNCWTNPNREQPWNNSGKGGKGGKGGKPWRASSTGPQQYQPLGGNKWAFSRPNSRDSSRSSNRDGMPNMCTNFQKGNCFLGNKCRYTHKANRRPPRSSTPRGNRGPPQYMMPLIQQDSNGQQVTPPPQPYTNEPQRVEITLLHSQPKV